MALIEALLFDLGDTLVDFGIGHAQARVAFREGAELSYDYLQSLKLEKALPDFHYYRKVHHRMMGWAYVWSFISGRDFCYSCVLERAIKRLEIPLSPQEQQELGWRWYERIANDAACEPGLHEMLSRLRGGGMKMAIVSNTLVPGYCIDRHLASLGLLEFFPVRVYSCRTRYRKPDRRIFETALKQLGISANRACFIGDVPRADIWGARRAGMKTVFKPSVKSGWRDCRPDYRIEKITDLPKVLQAMGCLLRQEHNTIANHIPVPVPVK